MSKSQRPVIRAGALLVSLLSAAPACAELPVTWVSASGDNASPCTRTLPCRDIDTAIGYTIAGGEIRALDSGPYPSFSIGKSVSIVGTAIRIVSDSPFSNSITVRVAAGKEGVVNLRGLVIDGGGIGGAGIYFESGAALHIQNSVIRGFNRYGIEFKSADDSQLFVSDTLISDVAQIAIAIESAAAAQRTSVVLDRVRIEYSQIGINVRNLTPNPAETFSFLIRDSIVSGNSSTAPGIAWSGIDIDQTNFAPQIVIDRSAIVNNGGYGIYASFPAIIHMSNSNVAGNRVGLYFYYSPLGSALDLRPNNNIVGAFLDLARAFLGLGVYFALIHDRSPPPGEWIPRHYRRGPPAFAR